MRAPVVLTISKLTCILGALLLAIGLRTGAALADEPSSEPAAPALMASGALRVSDAVDLHEDPEPVLGSFTVDGLTYAVTGEGEAMLVAVAPGVLANSLAIDSVGGSSTLAPPGPRGPAGASAQGRRVRRRGAQRSKPLQGQSRLSPNRPPRPMLRAWTAQLAHLSPTAPYMACCSLAARTVPTSPMAHLASLSSWPSPLPSPTAAASTP